MSQQNKKPPGPKTAICKESGCFHAAHVKGFCRLHFLSLVAGKDEGDQKPRGKLQAVPKERRQSNRLKNPNAETPLDHLAEESKERLGELDLDLESLDIIEILERKTG